MFFIIQYSEHEEVIKKVYEFSLVKAVNDTLIFAEDAVTDGKMDMN